MNRNIVVAFKSLLLITSSMVMLYLISCSNEPQPVQSTNNFQMMDDTLLNFNRRVVTAESQEIEDFIQRYHWRMNTTLTGLRFMIYKNGNGLCAGKGDLVCIKYTVNLINGDPVYHSDSLKPFCFEVGKGNVTSGLEEGVMLLKPGDHAKLIVPSHLAFGLLGDFRKIPNRAILVYDVELCDIKPVKK